MQHSVRFDQNDIKNALKEYAEKATRKKACPNGVTLHFTKAHPGDPRETDTYEATVRLDDNGK